jgi:hypothetical protein
MRWAFLSRPYYADVNHSSCRSSFAVGLSLGSSFMNLSINALPSFEISRSFDSLKLGSSACSILQLLNALQFFECFAGSRIRGCHRHFESSDADLTCPLGFHTVLIYPIKACEWPGRDMRTPNGRTGFSD